MNIVKITGDNFKEEVLEAKTAVLVDFWATWCGPCQMQAPVLDEIAQERDDIKIGKVNVDEENALAMQFRITGIPTLAVFKDGKMIEKLVGLRTKDDILRAMDL